MNSILNNPYRIVGLLVGATAREQDRQIKRLKQFIEAEQDPPEDFSFPLFGKVNRTIENVTDAASKLNLDSDRMRAALFWFYKGNSISDETIFDAWKTLNLKDCLAIWKELVVSGEVTQINSSAYQNLSTYALLCAYIVSKNALVLLEDGISLKLKFLESDFIEDFITLATDETYKTTKKDLQLLFLTQLQSDIDKRDYFSKNFLEIMNSLEFLAKKDFLKGFVQKPIAQIEKIVTETKNKRKENKANAYNLGKTLYDETYYERLPQIKSILGVSDIKFASISDKVSDEILQCGIDNFSYYQDSSTDPGNASMMLFRSATVLAIGNIAKQRCQENTKKLQEWINNKAKRDKLRLIEKDVEFIKAKLEWDQESSNTEGDFNNPWIKLAQSLSKTDKHNESCMWFQNLHDKIGKAINIVDTCTLRLVNLKKVLGSTDEEYLNICGAIVRNVEDLLITAVNEAQEGFRNYQTLGDIKKFDASIIRNTTDDASNSFVKKILSFDELLQIINNAYDVTTSMQNIDMVFNLKQSFQKNREILSGLRNELNSVVSRTESTTTHVPNSTSRSAGKDGCYIATMAYADYDHPQVITLRTFRDDVLDKSILGKIFIKIYYKYSPKLVEKLKDKKFVTCIIRQLLNQFIKLIK